MPNYRVTATSLRLRSGPGLNYDTIGMLYLNNIVMGGEITNEWVNVTTQDNKKGWSHRAYLELVDEVPPSPIEGQAKYRVDATSLYLRKGPGTTFAVIGALQKGELVDGLALSADKQWIQVRKSIGVIGWASIKYLTKVETPPSNTSSVYMTVTTDMLNVRSGPGAGYTVIDKVSRGERLIYIGASPDWSWMNVQTSQIASGWCSSRYLTEQNDFFATPEDYPATGFHRALTDTISMREGPDNHYPAVAEVPFNRVVNVVEISEDGKWKHCLNAWGEEGWYPIERLAPLGDIVIQKDTELPWLKIAYGEFGTREIPGALHNPKIIEYLMSTDLAQKYPSLPDETDWCSAFLTWCVKKAGLVSPNTALVNPWRSWGRASNPPKRGAVTTFLWDDGWAHVSLYLGEVGNYVICLGGNQSDAVWISVYHKKYVTSYRVY